MLVAASLLLIASPPLGLWPFALVALVPALYALRDRSGAAAFGWGWLLGFLVNLGGQSWSIGLLMRFGRMAWWTSAAAWIAGSAYQALVFAIWAWAFVRARRRNMPLPLAAGVSLVAASALIPFLFPWTIAIVLVPFWPATQVAELAGAGGVTFVLVLFNVAAFETLEALRTRRAPARGTLVALAAILSFGLARGAQVWQKSERAPKLRLGIVQPNFGVTTRQVRVLEAARLIDGLRSASVEAETRGAQLVVWPEAAWPMAVDRRLASDYPAGHVWQLRRGLHGPLLAGVLTLDFAGDARAMRNSAWLIDRDGAGVGFYDKVHLLAFGEYTPLGERAPRWRELVRARLLESDELEPGSEPKLLTLGDARIAPLICYEDTLADYVRRADRLEPNLLVTLANLAWFGDSAAASQALALAALRAVETRHEVVRATETGLSGRLDALGRVRETGPLIDPGGSARHAAPPSVMVVEAALVGGGRTVYSRVGDLFAWFCVGVAAFGVLPERKRRRRGRS